jgi:hypothetical protein
MKSFPPRRAASASLLVIACAALSACTDLPTGTESFQLDADGELWTAVVPPADLPSPATWLAYVAAESPEGMAAALEVSTLEADAMRARALGQLDRARDLNAAAALRAVEAMEVSPGPAVFVAGVASLESWMRSVRAGVDLTRVPALVAALEAVELDRVAVEEALRSGDEPVAALHLTRAAERVRDWAPQGVALRVLGRVEQHLAAAARSPGEIERATHLVQSARQELIAGNALRAVQRALYALQLAQGSELREIPVLERASCGEYAC